MMGGIYKIKNIINNKIYIGSSENINRRWWRHKNLLNKNKHHCKHLQRAWKKYKELSFVFEIIELTDELIKREQYWFNTLKPEYNSCPIAGSSKGWKHSKNTIEKLREINLGNKNPMYKENKKEKIKSIFVHHRARSKQIIRISNTGEIKEYKSITLAAKDLGLARPTAIQHVLNGRNKLCKGFLWKFKNCP